jgi:hypothetical protein
MATQMNTDHNSLLLDHARMELLSGVQGAELKYRAEYALLCAILEDAIRCFQRNAGKRDKRAQRLASEAKTWLFSDDCKWPFSFLNACAVLGLDAAYVRDGLCRWQQQHPNGKCAETTYRALLSAPEGHTRVKKR